MRRARKPLRTAWTPSYRSVISTLTRTDDGGWKIFGYDLTQSATTVEAGS